MSTKHLSCLDSLRGLACMIVVIVHSMMIVYPEIHKGLYSGASINYNDLLLYPPFSILIAGHASVCLFYVLSGFVLSYRFMGEGGMHWKVVEAIIKRPIRLSGVILAVMLPVYYMIVARPFWYSPDWSDPNLYINTIDRIFTSIFSYSMVCYNTPLWTISIELWGSFLVFCLCFLVGAWPKYIRMTALIVALIYFKNTYYIAFIFGVIAVDFYKNWDFAWFVSHKNTISYCILIPAVLLFSYPHDLTPSKVYLHDTAIIQSGYSMIGAILMFSFVMMNDKIKSMLEARPLVFIGEISFSIYVIHYLVMTKYIKLDRINSFLIGQWGCNLYLAFIIATLVGTTSIVVLAWLVDKHIDKPCIQFSAWFAKKLVCEIQKRLETALNMAKPISRNIRSIIPMVLHKCEYSQNSLILIREIEENDKLVSAQDQNVTLELKCDMEDDNTHDHN